MRGLIVFVMMWCAPALMAAPLLLRSGRIDPTVTTRIPQTIQTTQTSQTSQTSLLYIIQCEGKVPPTWRKQLLACGAKILRYIPENAYLVSVSSSELATIRAKVPYAQLVAYESKMRIDPAVSSLFNSTTTPRLNSTTTQSLQSSTSSNLFVVSLFTADIRTNYVAQINALTNCCVVEESGAAIRASLTKEGLAAISRWEAVEYVEPFIERTLKNNIAMQAPRLNVETVWPGGESGLGLTGAGQIVAVCDTGLDTGKISTLHKDVRGRVSRYYARGRSNAWSDKKSGHGTHVVGSVLGNGANSNSKIRGAAYEATLIMQSVEDSYGYLSGIPSDLNTLFSQAYATEGTKAGARIHSNSWGASSTGEYGTDAQDVDEFMFNYPDMLILFAASNDGADANKDGVIDPYSLSTEATTKNGLVVGAAENQRTAGGYSTYTWGYCWGDDYPAKPIYSDYLSRPADGTHQGMAAFSSRGPCQDGRIKPDLVAPGTDILSMHSSAAGKGWFSSSEGWGWGKYDSYYMYNGGTSMATPLVAGCAAVARQFLVDRCGIANPDAATLKALLMAGAKSLTPGQYGTGAQREIPDTYPNYVEGWGEVNMGNALTNRLGLVIKDAQIIQEGETQKFFVRAREGGQALAIVMAYADAPASLSAAKQLVDDLDLKVIAPSGRVYYPNSGTSPDHVNNVEGVRIAAAERGVYRIEITGYNIPTPMATKWTGGKADALRYSLVVNGAHLSRRPSGPLFIW